ncbi:MAG: hypothetical protein IJO65_08870 [Lachnospiraceae bacterium]|nr:hypothetical protein [Lachnospiraceae bacterium]
MSRNVYKAGWVMMNPDETRVIDSNILMEAKLNTAMQASSVPMQNMMYDENGYGDGFGDGFSGGLNAETLAVDALFEPEGAGMVIKSAAEGEKEALLEEIEAAKQELESLRAQADGMIISAKNEIGAMQMRAYEEAKNQGYQEGERLGREEADAAKAEYLRAKKELEADYRQKCDELEPEFINMLTGIYEHIFKVELYAYQDLIVNLFENTLRKIDVSGNLLLHVSKADYENVLAGKERLKAEVGSASLEIVQDMTLSASQCFIETDYGIYDCSLDTQLSEVARKLKLLSYER